MAGSPEQAGLPAQASQHCLCVLGEASAGMPMAVWSQAEPAPTSAELLSACLLELLFCLLPSLQAEDCQLQAFEAPFPLLVPAQE